MNGIWGTIACIRSWELFKSWAKTLWCFERYTQCCRESRSMCTVCVCTGLLALILVYLCFPTLGNRTGLWWKTLSQAGQILIFLLLFPSHQHAHSYRDARKTCAYLYFCYRVFYEPWANSLESVSYRLRDIEMRGSKFLNVQKRWSLKYKREKQGAIWSVWGLSCPNEFFNIMEVGGRGWVPADCYINDRDFQTKLKQLISLVSYEFI